jgi:hypothetical protein
VFVFSFKCLQLIALRRFRGLSIFLGYVSNFIVVETNGVVGFHSMPKLF